MTCAPLDVSGRRWVATIEAAKPSAPAATPQRGQRLCRRAGATVFAGRGGRTGIARSGMVSRVMIGLLVCAESAARSPRSVDPDVNGARRSLRGLRRLLQPGSQRRLAGPPGDWAQLAGAQGDERAQRLLDVAADAEIVDLDVADDAVRAEDE